MPDHNQIDLDEMYADYMKRKKQLVRGKLLITLFIIIIIIWSWIGTKFSIMYFINGMGNMAAFIWNDLLPPNFSAISKYIGPALESLYMAYVGTIISVFLSIFIAFFAAKNTSFHPIIATTSRSVIGFIRAVPAMVIGIFFVGAFGLGPVAGTLAIGIGGVGILAKAFADIIEEIDHGQVEAVRSTGASWLQVMGQAVWPQFYAGFIAWSFYKMDINIRESSVLGMIGAGGIGSALMVDIRLFQYKQAVVAIGMIFLLILCVEYMTAKIRERIIG